MKGAFALATKPVLALCAAFATLVAIPATAAARNTRSAWAGSETAMAISAATPAAPVRGTRLGRRERIAGATGEGDGSKGMR